MKILLPLSILAYICSLFPFLRTWDSNYRYADYCYSGDIFVEGHGFPCLVVGDDAIIEVFIYFMPILAIGICAFGIVALYNFFKRDFATLCYVLFLAVADIAIIMIALLATRFTLFIADKVGNICIHSQDGAMSCLTLTPSFITIYTICFLISLILVGLIHRWLFSLINWSD